MDLDLMFDRSMYVFKCWEINVELKYIIIIIIIRKLTTYWNFRIVQICAGGD